MCIYKAFNTLLVNDVFLKKLRLAIRGPEFLEQERGDRDSSKARNYQFELYMAAMFKNAGYEQYKNRTTNFIISCLRSYVMCSRREVQNIA